MTYKTCPKCGANLDAGERCDCEDRLIQKDIVVIVAERWSATRLRFVLFVRIIAGMR